MEGFKNLLKKKIAVYFVLILLIGGLFYFWQQSQSEIRELNKKLPPEIKIVKSLIGNEYQLVNQIDNYSFLVPKKWKGLARAEYTPERTEFGFTGSSIFVMGKNGEARTVSVDVFKAGNPDDLRQWAQKFLETFEFTPRSLLEEQVGDFPVIITRQTDFGPYIYFLEASAKVYLFSGGSEESVKYIISHGRW